MAEHRDFREDDVTLSLIQFRAADGARHVAALSDDGQARIAPGVESVVALARQALAAGESEPTDSMKMSLVGVDGGKPAPGTVGAQPEDSIRATAASARAAGGMAQSSMSPMKQRDKRPRIAPPPERHFVRQIIYGLLDVRSSLR